MNLSCWSVLGIEPTDDIRAIKRAYAALAHKISPEDEPEKFRELHDAYKSALFYAEHKVVFDDDDEFVEPGNNDEIDKSVEATVLEETTEIGIFPPVADIKPSQAGEKEPGTGFDFSSLDLDSVKVESAADVIIDDIVQFRESNQLTSREVIHNLPHDLAMHLSQTMFNMYCSLANAADDASVWDSFMEEPLIKYSINFSSFRKWALNALGEDCFYKDKLVKAFEKYADDANNDEIIKEKDIKPEPKINPDRVVRIFILCMIGLLAALLIGYLMFNKITPQNISEVMAGVLFMVLALGWGIYNVKK